MGIETIIVVFAVIAILAVVGIARRGTGKGPR